MEQQTGYVALLKARELQKKKVHELALKEAERLSALLRKEFEYETLYLIGSVVKGKGFRCRSDIDFVIKGLKKELFFKALALLIKNSSFEIDLKPWEEMSVDNKAKVEEEGRILK
jgi:predicted nucleotidyltransferase